MFTTRKKIFIILSVLMFAANVLAPNVAFGITHSTTFNLNVLQSILNYTLSATSIASLPQGSTGASTVTATLIPNGTFRTISSGTCDVSVEASGNPLQPWTNESNCVDNLSNGYGTSVGQSDNKSHIPLGLINQACGVDNSRWTTLSGTPDVSPQLVGTFTCTNPVIQTATASVAQPVNLTLSRILAASGNNVLGATTGMGIQFVSFSSPTITPTATSILTIRADNNVPAGTYTGYVESNTADNAAINMRVDRFNIVVTAVPQNLTADPGCGLDNLGKMDTSWDKIAGATGGYKLYRTPATPAEKTSPVTIDQPASGTRVIFEDTGLALNGLYGYRVSAIYGAVESGLSNLASNWTSSCAAPTLSASLTATPSSGLAPLNSTLTVPPVGGSALGDVTYQFKCKNTDLSWSADQTSDGNSTVTYTNTCSYSSAGTYTASARVTRQGITITPDLTTIVTATSQTCSIGDITQSGNDILIPVTVYPRSSTWTKLTRTYSGQTDEVDRDKNDTNYTFTDSGAGAQSGVHIYNLNYGTCSATKNIDIPPPLTTGFNLSATGPIEIIVIGGLGNRNLTSSAANITITPNGGFSYPVALSLDAVTQNGSPVADKTKFVATFSQSPVDSPYSGGSQLTITSNKNNPIPIGQYVLTIKGDGGEKTATRTVILNVRTISFQYQEF